MQDNTAYSSINYVSTNLATGAESPSTQLGRWRFDENDKIKEIDNVQTLYDIAIRSSIPEQFGSYEACDTFLRAIPFQYP